MKGQVSRDDASAILEATAIFNDAPEVEVRAQLAGLFLAMPQANRETADLAAMTAIYIEDLQEFPTDVVAEACRSWRRSEKWFPRIAELRDECWRVGSDRMTWKSAILDALSAAE